MADYTFQDVQDIIAGGIVTDNGSIDYGGQFDHELLQNMILPTWKWYNIIRAIGDVIGHVPFVVSGDPVSSTFFYDLKNGNYLEITYTSELGRCTLSATGRNPDGTAFQHENSEHAISGVVGTTSITYPGNGQAGWALGGFDIVFGYGHRINNDTHEAYDYNAGLWLIPSDADIGTYQPTIPTEAEAILPELAFTKFAYEMLWACCPIGAIAATSTGDTSALMDAFVAFMDGATAEGGEEYDTPDDNSTDTGGATFGDVNDPVPHSGFPHRSAIETGFVSLYRPSVQEIRTISAWLWSDNFFDNIIKNFSSPMENIIGLFISPVTPPASASTFVIGNLNSNISCHRVTDQYYTRNCGSVHVSPTYNSFADYEPYTTYKLFLPFYGFADILTDSIMNKDVDVLYKFDLLSGDANIEVGVDGHVLQSYHANVYMPIPTSGVNMMSFYSQTLAGAGQVIAGAASENPLAMASGVMNMITAKPSYAGSNGISGNAGAMGIQYPYLIKCRAVRDMPDFYSKYDGIPYNRFATLSSMSGYTEVESCRLNIASASDEEVAEILRLLKEGVIL